MMNIAKNKKVKEKNNKNLFHTHYRFDRSITMGLIVMGACWLTGALSGDSLAGAFLFGSMAYYLSMACRFPIDAYPKHSCQKFDNSINELFVATADSGLELIQRSDDLYIFQTKYNLFSNGRILVMDRKEYCEVITQRSVLECLSQHITSRKV